MTVSGIALKVGEDAATEDAKEQATTHLALFNDIKVGQATIVKKMSSNLS